MKRISLVLRALALLCALSTSALAIDVTISGASFPGYQYGGSTATLRIYASQTFTASDGTIVGGGTAPGSKTGFYTRVTCSIASNTLTCPSVTLKSTTDALAGRDTTYSVKLFDAGDAQRDFFPLSDFFLSHTAGSTQTWANVAAYNNAGTRPPAEGSYTTGQTDAAIESKITTPLNATYITQSSNATLPNEQSLGALTTGVVKNTVSGGTGTLSTAVAGTDYLAPSDVRVNQTVSMSARATAGAGTSGSPYTGWDAAGFASDTTYTFDAGKYYAYTTPIVLLDLTRVKFAGAGGPFFLKFNGTGAALTYKSTGLGGHYHSGIENALIIGNASTTEGLVLEAVHHMRVVNVSVRDVSQKCLRLKFAVANYFETFQCSQNGSAFTTVPVNGIYTELRGGNETVQENTFVNVIIEHMSGDGIVLNGAVKNHFLSGTSEGNGGRGVYVPVGSDANDFHLDNEANGAADFDLYGSYNVLGNVLSDGLITVRSGSKKNVVRGGKINSLTIESGSLYPYIENVNYNLSGTGTLTINEPTTTQWGVLTNIGTGGSGGGNVIVANPLILATTTGGIAWDTTTFNVIQLGGGAGLLAHKSTSNPGLNLPVNAYYDGTNWRYVANGFASLVYQQAGEAFFLTAPLGTAGSIITWTNSGKFGTDGKLYVNDAGSLKAVTYGANDSGGAGTKVLRIAN